MYLRRQATALVSESFQQFNLRSSPAFNGGRQASHSLHPRETCRLTGISFPSVQLLALYSNVPPALRLYRVAALSPRPDMTLRPGLG